MFWKVFRVTGNSMSPTLIEGDYVIVKKYKCHPIDGSVAVINHPELGKLIKRISLNEKNGKVTLSGDNSLSISDNIIGEFDQELIKYQALWRVSPLGFSRLNIKLS